MTPMMLSRNRRETDADPAPARTALCLLVMISTPEQIEAAERTLVWMAENEDYLSAETFREALNEIRLLAQIAAEDEEEE